jgi:hypothetical protein
VIDRIARTFVALSEYADFSKQERIKEPAKETKESERTAQKMEAEKQVQHGIKSVGGTIALDSLQYHINIILPESRDQAVYDAIFRSLRDHLGTRHG